MDRAGGDLVMCGGYLSFSGIYESVCCGGSPIERVLSVTIRRFDDRGKALQGARVTVHEPGHSTVNGVNGAWPVMLGNNEAALADGPTLVASIDDTPFLAVREVGKGKSLVWTSEIGPQWCPMPFLEWDGYTSVRQQAVRWVAGMLR